jgi:ATP-binding cassette subfamily C (CFTR/MRP) protein 1
VSLARAAYSESDIVILDDPLSALDPKVGERVFAECILGLMKEKTRVLVTNQLQFLKKCDKVVVLGNGGVLEEGPYEELLQTDGEVKRLLNELDEAKVKEIDSCENDRKDPGSDDGEGVEAKSSQNNQNNAGGANNSSNVETEKAKKEKDGTLVTKEERAVGAVKLQVYRKYLAAGGGNIRFAFVYFTFVLCAAVELWKTAMISLWTADSSYKRFPIGFYMGLYAGTAVVLGVVTFIRSFNVAMFGVRASQKMHDDLLASILKAPMSFFDTTPTGRIISRFSKDLFSIDSELSEVLDFFLW